MLDLILSLYAQDPLTQHIQRAQAGHRLRLIDIWAIPAGARVLEIGCGQGDTTVALAYRVGRNGFVHGVDIAPPQYGAPETLGDARRRILSSPLGKRIQIDLETDVLDPSVQFADGAFDCAVLSHCTWYFSSHGQLQAILRRVRPWVKRLCLAEWDPRASRPEQLPHQQAVMLQALCESFREGSESNVRTLFYPSDLERAVTGAGFSIERTGSQFSPTLQDGQWEVDMTVSLYPQIVRSLAAMPERMKALLLAQIEALRAAESVLPLSSFWLTAH